MKLRADATRRGSKVAITLRRDEPDGAGVEPIPTPGCAPAFVAEGSSRRSVMAT
jgi:hypothetical protein